MAMSIQMVGLIPGKVKMQKKLAALGYREIFGTKDNFLIDRINKQKVMNFITRHLKLVRFCHMPMKQKVSFGRKQEGYLKQSCCWLHAFSFCF